MQVRKKNPIKFLTNSCQEHTYLKNFSMHKLKLANPLTQMLPIVNANLALYGSFVEGTMETASPF